MTIKSAIILAAGLGTRMQAAADAPPKPLTKLAGTSLLDFMIAKLIAADVAHIIINMHFKADMMIAHLADHNYDAEIILSDERAALLDTGGGVAKAHSLLASKLQAEPFFICNADIVWLETSSNLRALAQAFNADDMDACLLLTDRNTTCGYEGAGDFNMDAQGHIMRPNGPGGYRRQAADYVYTGVQVAHPRLLVDAPQGAFSLNLLWDRAFAKTRLYGHKLVGEWLHVGTKAGLAAAEKQLTADAQDLSPPPKNKL